MLRSALLRLLLPEQALPRACKFYDSIMHSHVLALQADRLVNAPQSMIAWLLTQPVVRQDVLRWSILMSVFEQNRDIRRVVSNVTGVTCSLVNSIILQSQRIGGSFTKKQASHAELTLAELVFIDARILLRPKLMPSFNKNGNSFNNDGTLNRRWWDTFFFEWVKKSMFK
jgi:hypothetical protein